MKALKTIILAAGAGTRMKSDRAKVLHTIAGKSLLDHVIENAKEAGSGRTAVITGHQRKAVEASLPKDIEVYVQEEQLGTGHAVMQADSFIKEEDADILILCGDAPLTKPETIRAMLDAHRASEAEVTVMSAVFDNPTGYGRIIKDGDRFLRITEEKDCTEEERKIKEINSGIYLFDSQTLTDALLKLTANNVQQEYYLTDAIEHIRKAGGEAKVFVTDDPDDIAAVNSKQQLAEAGAILRGRINRKLMDEGVILIDPAATYIDKDVVIGRDTIVYPGCVIEGKTVIGENCIIGQNSHLRDAILADDVDVEHSTIYESSVGAGSHVGPYAYIRPGSQIGQDCKVGDFVEVKNAVMKDGAKASHLTYIGDAEVGRNVNLGCGTVFVNYDGMNKHRTVVGDDVFIGCNANLVSPVTIGDGAFVAAGSTVTQDVPADALAVARVRQVNKEGYAEKLPPAEKRKKKDDES